MVVRLTSAPQTQAWATAQIEYKVKEKVFAELSSIDEFVMGTMFDWVLIPAGEFLIGSDRSQDPAARETELPQHRLYLPDYRIARFPVTVAQFAQFVAATGYKTTAEREGFAWGWTGRQWGQVPGTFWARPRVSQDILQLKANHPVTCISWQDADAFCTWAQVRLPTESEWEKAARGSDGRLYPWGNAEPNKTLCNFNMNVGDSTPVDTYPAGSSPYRVLDMAGNVWEWTSTLWGRDWQRPEFIYPYTMDGRDELSAPEEVLRVLRGGAYDNDKSMLRCASRGVHNPIDRNDLSVGFRVVALD